jgi:hypothetical protein
MIGRRHRGRLNQPNNHSKLTDSNNCTVFFVSDRYCSCRDSLHPVSSAGHPPLWLFWLSSLGDTERMLNMSQKPLQAL